MSEKITHFVDQLREKGIPTEVTIFQSGAVMLDVRYGNRFYVLAYSPNAGFGVDEVLENDGIGTNYRFGFPNFESAKAKILSMLEEAGSKSLRVGTDGYWGRS